MIQWRKITDNEQVKNYLAEVIKLHLDATEKVLWFIPGGSALEIAVEVSKQLRLQNLKNLTVTLTDERFGPVGHKDSNWQQLLASGFSLPGATLQPVLSSNNLVRTVQVSTKKLEKNLAKSNFSLALTGIGTDGHIFGIKPGSPAINSKRPVVGYEWSDYTRITLTSESLQKIDEVIVYAVGQEKRAQLAKLEEALPASKQPAQLLKQLNKVIIFNDYKGENI